MPRKLPKLLKATAAHVQKKAAGKLDQSAAYAVATSALQRAGYLKKGTNKLTKRGGMKRIKK